jgi:hypothetical protein
VKARAGGPTPLLSTLDLLAIDSVSRCVVMCLRGERVSG